MSRDAWKDGPEPAGHEPAAEGGLGGFQIEDVLEILERRRWWILGSAVLGLAAGLLLFLVLPARYEASTTILVEPQEVPESYVKSTVTLDIEQRLNTLRERVTSFANLTELIDRVGPDRLDPEHEYTREELIGFITANLSVESGASYSKQANVFEISYQGKDPEVVAAVTREIASLFITENLKDRAQQATATAEFLDRELERLRGEVARQEQKIREFKEQRMGALPSELDANLRSLDRLNNALASNLAGQEAAAQRVALVNAQMRNSGGSSVGPGGPAPGSVGAALIEARKQLLEAQRVYTDEHPTVKRWTAEVARLEAAVRKGGDASSATRIPDPALGAMRAEAETAQLDIERLRKEEERLRKELAELQTRVEQTPRMEEDLLTLTRDYDNMTKTYQSLLGKKYEAALARNLEQAQKGERFKVLHPVRVPTTPSWPSLKLLLPGGAGVSLALCALAVAVAELRNPSFRSVSRLTRTTGLPIVASIPRIEGDQIFEQKPTGEVDPRLVVFTAPQSAPAEQYRSFIPVLLEHEERRVVLVTSAQRGDGKSLSCMNLALTVACDLGRRVLLIDGDLRRPTAHRLLRVKPRIGLTTVLQKQANFEDAVLETPVPNLSLLPAGRPVKNPLALLTSPTFLELIHEARSQYDAVFIDSPPLLPVVDTRFLKKLADLVLFVVRADATPREAATRSMRELRSLAGIVFNEVSAGSFRRYYYYDAYSRYAYGDPSEEADTVEERARV
ncbi:MAG TPA: polysaccharide biosynthesis tyrosine autokinase [Myxococcota bacterium]|jgi:polysaccharide chain length determinant protein (PEP-CTERM system associated)|nr:polysaccharide biosynthesis tyrosine autokinase [Myxococcota bacterium]